MNDPDLLPYALERDFNMPKLRTPCPKCDGKGVNVSYCTTEHAGQVPVYGYKRGPEHLDLTCQWCGYIRFMVTKDYGVMPVQERVVSTDDRAT